MRDVRQSQKMLRVVTFATPDYANASRVLRHAAFRALGAARFREYTPSDVDAWLLSRGLSPSDRGHGWYAWKAHVIRRELEAAADGELVLYLDSTCLPEPFDPAAAATALTPRADVHLFALAGGEYPLREWTSPRCLAALDPDSRLRDRQQLNAAGQLYVAGPAARAFAAEYERLCGQPDLVSDEPGFERHRHDQAVLSCLAYSSSSSSSVFVDSDFTQYAPGGVPTNAAGLRVQHHRRRFPRMPRLAVITATRGGRHLPETLAAVQRQSLPGIEHWVVADGPDAEARVAAAVAAVADGPVPVVRLTAPKRTGADGWNGHRVYGAVPWLAVDATHVAWLDDDNVPLATHYEQLVRALAAAPGARWAHSLRAIVDADGRPVCVDGCESLGGISHCVDRPGEYLVDTSCYLVERDLAVELSGVWASPFRGPWEPDRELCKALLAAAPHAVVRAASLKYRLGGSQLSVREDFFAAGNARMAWRPERRDAYLFHFSPDATAAWLAKRDRATDEVALDEWQPSLWRGLLGEYNLLNGFTNYPNVPHGALCLVALCHPGTVPLEFFAERRDLRRVVYTLESPNVRHAAQWSRDFLTRHFDVCMTYWRRLLDDPAVRTVPTPHNTHHLEPESRLPRRIGDGDGRARGVVVVAECRDLRGSYEIDGAALTCLDPLRKEYVAALCASGVAVTAHGVGWDAFAAAGGAPGLVVASATHRSRDPRPAVDLLAQHDWALIVENCDAEGYCSEKLYDAFIAGTVPLYHGSPPAWVPRDAFVDLRTTPIAEVARLVASPAALAGYRAALCRSRDGVLAAVGTASFARAAREAIALMDSPAVAAQKAAAGRGASEQ